MGDDDTEDMNSEKFSLRWNDFQTNISKSFSDLRREKDFFDVTLISDDQSKFLAHKVVLSSCSSFFKSILRIANSSNPIIYLSGVSSWNLSLALDYMYQGEVQVFQELLDDFLVAAQNLKIQGLISNSGFKSGEVPAYQQVNQIRRKNERHFGKKSYYESENYPVHLRLPEESFKLEEFQNESPKKAIFNGSLRFQDYSSIDVNNTHNDFEDNGWKCKACGKSFTTKFNLKKHEANHNEGRCFECLVNY